MSRPIYKTLSAEGSTSWELGNWNAQPFQLTISVQVTGSVTYSVEYTYDDVFGLPNPSSWSPTTPNPTVLTDPILDSVSTSGETTFDNPIAAWRVTYESGSGSLAIAAIQAGITG